MHILLIHQVFVPPSKGGGTRHYELAKYFVELGHQVTIIASNVDYLSADKQSEKEIMLDGIRVIYAHTYSKVHKSFFSRALAFLSFMFSSFWEGLKVKNVNVVIGTSPPLFQSISTMILAKIKRRPFIFEVRDLWLDFAVELGVTKKGVMYRILKLVERLLYRSADQLVVNSPGFISHLTPYRDKKDIHLFANGVISEDFERIDEAKVAEFRKTYQTDGKFVVMYTGNIGMANDFETIISTAELCSTIPDIQFLIVGGGMYTDKLKATCQEKGLQNISFHPPIPKTEIPNLIQIADVCLATLKNIPLFGTVYPNKVFDYMAASKPTILAIRGSIQDVIEKANAGIVVEPGNSAAIKDAILSYYENRSKINEHGDNGKQYVKAHFERKNIATEFATFLDSVATH